MSSENESGEAENEEGAGRESEKKSPRTFQEVMSEIGWGRDNPEGSHFLKPEKGKRKILAATVPKRRVPETELTEQDIQIFVSLFDPKTLEEPD